jgi:malonyl-CoA/methylmalonyl-CoA synthetase
MASNSTDVPMTANLYAHLRAAFPKSLTSTAVETIDGGSAALFYTWNDLEQGSAMLANALKKLGVRKGDRVAVQTHKSVEAMMLYLATLRMGAVFVPLNTAYQAGEMAHFISDSKPTVVVCDTANEGWLKPLCAEHAVAQLVSLNANRTGSLLDLAAQQVRTFATVSSKANDIAAILYTSGTTGRSKGALLSHNNLLSNAQTLKAHWGWRAKDVLIHVLPIFHVHGLFVAIHGALLAGAKMLWAAKFEPAQVLANFSRATVFMGAHTVCTLVNGKWFNARSSEKHAYICCGLSAALGRNVQRMASQHRAHDCGTLWHERNCHADV